MLQDGQILKISSEYLLHSKHVHTQVKYQNNRLGCCNFIFYRYIISNSYTQFNNLVNKHVFYLSNSSHNFNPIIIMLLLCNSYSNMSFSLQSQMYLAFKTNLK